MSLSRNLEAHLVWSSKLCPSDDPYLQNIHIKSQHEQEDNIERSILTGEVRIIKKESPLTP